MKKIQQPQGAILDAGLMSLQLSGLEHAEGVTGSVARVHTGQDGSESWFLTTPVQVTESIRNLNAAVLALDSDVAANVKRQAFTDSWSAWKAAWDGFQKDNDSTIKLLLHGTGAMWRQTEEYRKQLDGWRAAYQRETGNLAPSGPVPVAPGPGLPTKPKTNWALWGLGLAAIVGVGGYFYWKAMQPARRRVGELRERVGSAVLTRGASELRLRGGEGD
jgi:hypothetical protein